MDVFDSLCGELMRNEYMADVEAGSTNDHFPNEEEKILSAHESSSEAGDDVRRLTQSIIDTVRTPVLVLDKKSRVVSANPSFYHFFHTTAAVIEGRFPFQFGNHWDIPALRKILESIVSEKKEILDFECTHTFPLLGLRKLLLNIRKIPGIGNDVEMILLSFEDVTDRDKAERYRREKEKAEQATQTKNEFLASMSHEIRTPMTIALAALEHVLETDLHKDQRKFLEMAMASSHSLLGIIDDILDLSKIEAGKLEFSEAPFLIFNLLESIVETFSAKSQMKGLKLSCNISPELPPIILGDQNRLRQVLVNLLGNALKFTERGEVALTVEPAGRTECGERQFISFTIRDTGIGIPCDKQEEIFQSFSQINSPESGEKGGAGLGLAICKRIVEQSGGDMILESREHEGSVFTFKMPFGLAPANDHTGSSSRTPARSKSKKPEQTLRILLLEDEADIRELITILLETRGWNVVTASSGEEGLAAWERERFDLILMDLRMPVMDGFEATRRIREKEEGEARHVPIIALTAHVMKNDPEKCLQAGMDAFIAKPFKSDEFLSLVERCLTKSTISEI